MESEREELLTPSLPVAEERSQASPEGTSSGSEDLELEADPVEQKVDPGDFVPGKRRKMPEKVTKTKKSGSKKGSKKGKSKANKAGTGKLKSIKKGLQSLVKRCGNV
jgi:hypothetical protein